jgi:hypothetical protein
VTELLFRDPFKVMVNGFEPRAQERLAMFLQGRARGICEVVGEEQAEAAIVDLDGFGGEQLWPIFRARFQGPAVIMSVGEKRLPNALWVRKPVIVEDFLQALRLVHQRLKAERQPTPTARTTTAVLPVARGEPAGTGRLPAMPAVIDDRRPAVPQLRDPSSSRPSGDADGVGRAAGLAWTEQQIHESCGAMEDAVYLDPMRRGELFYEPADYLQGVLQMACRQARESLRPARVDLGGLSMIVLAGGRQVFSDTREQRLRPLCVIPVARRSATVSELRDDELPRILPADPRLLRSETMLWLVSLWASRGRVPRGTDLDAAVSLANWPGFSRLLIPPRAMQIAALWSARPQSLMQTARVLAIPHRYVFGLYSACLTVGLAEQSGTANVAAADLADGMTAPAEKRGILGSLLRKLRMSR